jgi:hypothetical protein
LSAILRPASVELLPREEAEEIVRVGILSPPRRVRPGFLLSRHLLHLLPVLVLASPPPLGPCPPPPLDLPLTATHSPKATQLEFLVAKAFVVALQRRYFFLFVAGVLLPTLVLGGRERLIWRRQGAPVGVAARMVSIVIRGGVFVPIGELAI